MERRKLILITHGYPFGESERSFVSAEIEVLEKKYDLTVMAICQPGADVTLKYGEAKGFRTYRFRWKEVYSKKYALRAICDTATIREMMTYLPKVERTKKVCGFVKRSIVIKDALEEIIKKNGADIIYTFWCTEETYAAILLKKKYPKLKVVSRLHGYDLYKERNPEGIQPMHKVVANKADLLAFVSKYGQQYFKQYFPGKTETIVAYLGSRDFGELKRGKECSFVIASCSSIITLKRVERIIEALSKTSKKLHWIHIGDGDQYEFVLEYAHKLLDKSNCTFEFLGSVPNNRLPEIYHKTKPDLFITTSSTEGLPVSIVEAISCGIPTIATDVGGVSEIILDGENGYLLSSEARVEEIVAAIERFYLLKDDSRVTMQKNARKTFVTTFNAQINAEKFVETISQLLDE